MRGAKLTYVSGMRLRISVRSSFVLACKQAICGSCGHFITSARGVCKMSWEVDLGRSSIHLERHPSFFQTSLWWWCGQGCMCLVRRLAGMYVCYMHACEYGCLRIGKLIVVFMMRSGSW